MQFELKKIGVWSVAKISFVLMGSYGFFIGLIYALFIGLIVSVGVSNPLQEMEIARDAAPFIIVLMPILFAFMTAVFGTVVNIIVVVIYNLVARLLGGIELELVQYQIQPSAGYNSKPQPTSSPKPTSPAPSPKPTSPPPSIKPYRLPDTTIDTKPKRENLSDNQPDIDNKE